MFKKLRKQNIYIIKVIICDLIQENEANISEKERLQRVYDLENTNLEEIGNLYYICCKW